MKNEDEIKVLDYILDVTTLDIIYAYDVALRTKIIVIDVKKILNHFHKIEFLTKVHNAGEVCYEVNKHSPTLTLLLKIDLSIAKFYANKFMKKRGYK